MQSHNPSIDHMEKHWQLCISGNYLSTGVEYRDTQGSSRVLHRQPIATDGNGMMYR